MGNFSQSWAPFSSPVNLRHAGNRLSLACGSFPIVGTPPQNYHINELLEPKLGEIDEKVELGNYGGSSQFPIDELILL